MKTYLVGIIGLALICSASSSTGTTGVPPVAVSSTGTTGVPPVAVASALPFENTRARLLDIDSGAVFVVSHRALWRKGGENSLASIEAAIQAGVDLIECDVRVTKDGVAVLSHDHTVDRCSNGKGKVENLTFAELRQLKLRAYQGGKGEPLLPETFPTFEEALKLANGRVMFNVDETWGALDETLRVIAKLGVERQILIKCYGMPEKVKARFGKSWTKVEKGELLFMPILRTREEYAAWQQEKYVKFFEVLGYNDDGKLPTADGSARIAGVRTFTNTLWGKRSDTVSKLNPDNGWNWYLKRGITMLQSDDPEALIDWLKTDRKSRPHANGVVYEAEAATLSEHREGQKPYTAAAPCEKGCLSGGKFVRFLGRRASNDLIWKDVQIEKTGKYRLAFDYCYSSDDRTVEVQIDGGKPVTLATPMTRDRMKTASLTVELTAGTHTVRLYREGAWAADFDRMRVAPVDR